MENKKKYAMFFDIDGTILFGNWFPTLVKWAIKKAQKAGHVVIINTGRPKASLPPKVMAGVKWDGFICCASHGELHGNVVFSERFERDNLEGLCKIVDKYNLPASLDRAEGKSYLTHWKNRENNLENAMDALKIFEEAKINKVEIRTEISQKIRDEMAEFATPYNMGSYDDVFITGMNKGFALLKMAKALGIPKENTVAFGDNMNDAEMLSAAGISFAMSTAPQKVRDLVTHYEKVKYLGVFLGIMRLLKK